MPHLAIYDKESAPTVSDTFVTSASIPISCLRKGLRSVKLFDVAGETWIDIIKVHVWKEIDKKKLSCIDDA